MRWPDRAAVRRAVADWAAALAAARPEVAAVGYFGSLAREAGWSVGSDADLVVLVDGATEPFERRGSTFDTSGLPVPVDLLVYDLAEWSAGLTGNPFRDRIRREVVWAYRWDDTPSPAGDAPAS